MPRTARRAAVAAMSLSLAGLVTACSGDVLDLDVGDCFDRADLVGPEVTTVTTVACEEPHDAEVFAALEHEGEEFPGPEAVQVEAEARCTAEFESFVGVPYIESELMFSVLTPTQGGWDRAGDRTSLCILLIEEKVTGSLRGAAR